jgi:hypothetical protein
VAEKSEAGVTSQVEGRAGVGVEEPGAGLAEADFGARSEVELKLKEEFCWKAQEAGRRIVGAGRQLAYGVHKGYGGVRGRLGKVVSIVREDMDGRGPRRGRK